MPRPVAKAKPLIICNLLKTPARIFWTNFRAHVFYTKCSSAETSDFFGLANPGRPEELHTTKFQEYPKISPFLWFDANAEEAVDLYLSVFKALAVWVNCELPNVNFLRFPSNWTAKNSPRLTAVHSSNSRRRFRLSFDASRNRKSTSIGRNSALAELKASAGG